MNERFDKGWKRARRVGYLASKLTAAEQLVTTGVKPQTGYEHLVRGTAPGRLDELRSIYTAGLSQMGRFACRATTLAWKVGEGKDPWIANLRDRIALCFRLWWSSPPREKIDFANA